jgi:Na+/proline symporter
MFVALAYFGTDQSQVQRYLSGASLAESRLGLLFNGVVKVPMQFLILFVGVMVFAFYQFQRPPLIFNEAELSRVRTTHGAELATLESAFTEARQAKQRGVEAWLASPGSVPAKEELRLADQAERGVREQAKKLVAKTHPRGEPNDADYIFLSFVVKHFPAGLVGLLIAVILCAAMSATASALNALGTTTVIDFYKRLYKPEGTEADYLFAAKGFTVFWGAAAVAFAVFASQLDNLIQAVNILGSIFYGPMLGVFLVGFFLKWVKGTAAFWATVVAQAVVVAVFAASSIGYLWYNVIGCAVVLLLAPAFTVGRRLAVQRSDASGLG